MLEWESNYWLILKKQVLLIRRDAVAKGSSLALWFLILNTIQRPLAAWEVLKR